MGSYSQVGRRGSIDMMDEIEEIEEMDEIEEIEEIEEIDEIEEIEEMDELEEIEEIEEMDDWLEESGYVDNIDEELDLGSVGDGDKKVTKYNRLSFLYVDISDVEILDDYISQDPHKDIQKLAQDIQEYGLLEPIKILKGENEGEYSLVDGLRRIKVYKDILKRDSIAAVIIGDSNKIAKKFGDDFLRFKLAHRRGFSVRDKYDLIDKVTSHGKVTMDDRGVLELEELLELNQGDFEKMLDLRRDANLDEVKGRDKACVIYKNLVDGKIKSETEIGMAHKKLENRRKKDIKDMQMAQDSVDSVDSKDKSDLGKDDNSQMSEEYGDKGSDGADSSDDGGGDLNMPTTAEGIAGMIDSGEINKHNKQDRKTDNDRLDPDLRKAVLARDRNTCLACGVGTEAPEVFGTTFEVHHLRPVYLGGVDRIDELGTFCKTCHALIHALERGKLIFPSGEDFKGLSVGMQERLLRVNHYGGLAIAIKKGKTLPKNLFYMSGEVGLECNLGVEAGLGEVYDGEDEELDYDVLNDVQADDEVDSESVEGSDVVGDFEEFEEFLSGW
jgi:hypothetical protein